MAPKDFPGQSGSDKPFGDRLRDIVNAAMEDSRRHDLQYELVNTFFQDMAQKLEPFLMSKTGEFFNTHARIADRHPDKKNLYTIEQVTTDGVPTFYRLGIPLNPAFLELTAQDIKDMPGYIALHEKARDLNIALGLSGLTMEENRGQAQNQPVLVVSPMQTYDDGAMENSAFYPNLPPRPVAFDKHTSSDYVL
jgi:hypothetical protein